MVITIGADPEVFLETKTKHKIVPSQGLIEGTKYEKNAVEFGGYVFPIHRDNVLAEYNIQPSQTSIDFALQIDLGRKAILSSIKKASKNKLSISTKASHEFSEEELDNEEAKTFGCDPDLNAWTYSVNTIPEEVKEGRLRTAGGHVHVGYVNDFPNISPINLVRHLDIYLGLLSVFLDPDNDRRKVYGQAGAYRMTPWGIEYRVLSNFWIFNLSTWVFNAARKAVAYASNTIIEDDGAFPQAIQDAINNSDLELAGKAIHMAWERGIMVYYPTASLLTPEQAQIMKKYFGHYYQ